MIERVEQFMLRWFVALMALVVIRVVKAAADEPNGIPRNTVSMPPRSRPKRQQWGDHTSGVDM